MSDIDPLTPGTTEVRTPYDSAGAPMSQVRRTEVRSSPVGWWIAGLVTLVAIVALLYVVTRPAAQDAQVQASVAAADQARVQGEAEGALSAQDAQTAAAVAQANGAALAQSNAQSAMQASQSALQAEADRAAAARAQAERAADQAAASAARARNASASVPPSPADTDTQ